MIETLIATQERSEVNSGRINVKVDPNSDISGYGLVKLLLKFRLDVTETCW